MEEKRSADKRNSEGRKDKTGQEMKGKESCKREGKNKPVKKNIISFSLIFSPTFYLHLSHS